MVCQYFKLVWLWWFVLQRTWRRSSQWGDTRTAPAIQRTQICRFWFTVALGWDALVWSFCLRSWSHVWNIMRYRCPVHVVMLTFDLKNVLASVETAGIWCLNASPDRIRKCRRFWTCCDSSVWWWYRRCHSTPSFTKSSFSSWRTPDWSEFSADMTAQPALSGPLVPPLCTGRREDKSSGVPSSDWSARSITEGAGHEPGQVWRILSSRQWIHQYYTQILLWALTRDRTWPGTFYFSVYSKARSCCRSDVILNSELLLCFTSGFLLQWNDFIMKDWKHTCESHKYPVRYFTWSLFLRPLLYLALW